MARYKYRIIEIAAKEADPAKTDIVYLIRDDGYRWDVKALEHPAQNVLDEDWEILFEYKHFNFPGIASDIMNRLLGKVSLLKSV